MTTADIESFFPIKLPDTSLEILLARWFLLQRLVLLSYLEYRQAPEEGSLMHHLEGYRPLTTDIEGINSKALAANNTTLGSIPAR